MPVLERLSHLVLVANIVHNTVPASSRHFESICLFNPVLDGRFSRGHLVFPQRCQDPAEALAGKYFYPEADEGQIFVVSEVPQGLMDNTKILRLLENFIDRQSIQIECFKSLFERHFDFVYGNK
jgi:hypothetical protein